MPIEITRLDSSNCEAVYRTAVKFWNQGWPKSFETRFLDWRYGSRPSGETLVAMSGSECVGLIDSFIRPYWVGAEQTLFWEPADWYCLPQHRGLGLKLMKLLMAQGPLLGTDLSSKQVAVGPRLRWSHVAEMHEFVLPISLRRVAASALRKLGLGDGTVAKHIPRGVRLRSGAAQAREIVGGKVNDLDGTAWPELRAENTYALAPVLTDEYLKWLHASPLALGDVFSLVFQLNEAAVGATVCRVEPAALGRRAKIIHMQARDPSPDILEWMLAENVFRAIQMQAEIVHCRSSCPATQAALASLRFISRGQVSAFTSRATALPPGSINLTFLRGDDAMIPSWFNK